MPQTEVVVKGIAPCESCGAPIRVSGTRKKVPRCLKGCPRIMTPEEENEIRRFEQIDMDFDQNAERLNTTSLERLLVNKLFDPFNKC